MSVFEILRRNSIKLLCYFAIVVDSREVNDINKSYNYISNLLHLFTHWPVLFYEGKYDGAKGEHCPD